MTLLRRKVVVVVVVQTGVARSWTGSGLIFAGFFASVFGVENHDFLAAGASRDDGPGRARRCGRCNMGQVTCCFFFVFPIVLVEGFYSYSFYWWTDQAACIGC